MYTIETTIPNLPDLPQTADVRELALRLWQRPYVLAIWLGGSMARGDGDPYSDIDMRICVTADAFETWKQPDFRSVFGDGWVTSRFHTFGPTVLLHHTVLRNGVVVDLLIHHRESAPFPDHTVILACRDADLEAQLAAIVPTPAVTYSPADAAVVRQAIESFWIDNSKQVRLLYRNLDQLSVVSVGLERMILMRLWYIDATGCDPGPLQVSIFGLTAIVRAVEASLGPHAVEVLGTPVRNRAEIVAAVGLVRDEISLVGQRLAASLGFEYPSVLEDTVRASWRAFLDSFPEGVCALERSPLREGGRSACRDS